ncbi:IgGFc-binding protein [Candidatus Kapabacteria bacterium]|nr:IgGFc-binding protein [Candidatus Kapabacteria bacterium]
MKLFIITILLSINIFCQEVDQKILDDLKSEAIQKIVKNPDGKEFWLCFMRNHTDSPTPNESTKLTLKLFITSDYDANVTIEIKALNQKTNIFVPKGTVRNVEINKLAQVKSSEVIEQGLAVHVQSDNPVNVYGLNRRKLTTDTFLGLPVGVLGKEYLAIGYNIAVQLTSQFAIVATENNTEVTIIPSVKTANGVPAGQEISVVLNKGDVYQVASAPKVTSQNRADLTGSYIKANKKISFFSGHQCAYVPDNVHACNHLVEQVPPINAWGTHYYIGKQKRRSKYTYRVLASKNDTKIFENYKLLATLNTGQYIERTSNDDVQLTASNPVLVSQYSQGFRNGDSIGDPMMLLISPTQQFLTKYRFATPVSGAWQHYVNIVVPTSSLKSIKLDGKPIPRNKFKRFGTSRYSISYLNVKFGTHELTADEPFGMSSYGFGYDDNKFDAYGNIGGQSFFDYQPTPDTLAPTAEIVKQNKISNLLIRDDRVNDLGLAQVKVLVASNFNFKEEQIEKGTPQIAMQISVADPSKPGSVTVNTTDEAGNTQKYTVCYSLDPKTGTFRYYLNEGEQQCELNPNFSISIFSKNSYLNHSADFSSSGALETPGNFNDATDFNFGFGGALSYGILPKMNLTARLYFDKFSGVLTAPDTITSNRRVGLDLITVQEASDIEINSWNFNFGLSMDYYFNSRFYVLSGLRMNVMMGNNLFAQRRLIIPNNLNYTQTETDSKLFDSDGNVLNQLDSFSGVGFGGFAGVGFSERVYNDFSVYSELIFDYQFNNLISDGSWDLWQFYINLGIKHPL